MSEKVKELIKSVHRLAATDPESDNVEGAVDAVSDALTGLGAVGETPDIRAVEQQIDSMFSAASVPAHNYKRMAEILRNLKGVCVAARKPQNAPVRPRIAAIVSKVAGLFAEVDTAEDLDKPLSEIERAVHSLYGDQSKNSTYYFNRRGKGGHGKGD